MTFVDRDAELKVLNEEYRAKRPSFVAVLGRRRLGKTELIKRFMKGKRGVYYLATNESAQSQLKSLSRLVGLRIGDEELARFGAVDWEAMFMRLANAFASKNKAKLVLAIDEFPYLVKAYAAMPSIFQKGWELYLKGANVMLVLSGSSIGMMQSTVMNYSAPLYMRNTALLQLKPLAVKHAMRLAKGMRFIDALQTYFIFGGVPAYYIYVEGSKTFAEVLEKVFKPGSIFAEELSVILSEEVKNDSRYIEIVDLISSGINRPSEMASKLGIPASNVIRCLKVLERLSIVAREVPVTERAERKSKLGSYIVTDNYASFWCRYVKRSAERMQPDNANEIVSLVLRDFNVFSGHAFENFAREFIAQSSASLGGLKFTKIGRWWGKNPSKDRSGNEEEIDIVALNEKTKDILFAECKWRNEKTGIDTYEDLKRKAALVGWHAADRTGHYALFSKSGFTEELKRLAEEEGVMLFDLPAIERTLR